MTDPSDIATKVEPHIGSHMNLCGVLGIDPMGHDSTSVQTMATAEITRLRAALAQRTEECARVADEMAVLAQYLASATEIDPLREQRIAESAQSLSIAAAIRSITP